MRTVVAVAVLLAALSLTGCLEGASGESDDGTSSSSSSSTSRSSTSSSSASASGTTTAASPTSTSTSGGPAPEPSAQPMSSSTSTGGQAAPPRTAATNHAPVAGIGATPSKGQVPLNVNVTIAGSDPDGDALGWILSFGDGTVTTGTFLPATLSHHYTEAGFIKVQLRVADRWNETLREFTLNLTSGAVAAEPPAAPDTHCHRDGGDGPVYAFEGDNGNWVFVEANDIPGLQVQNNHPSEEAGVAEPAGEHNAAWEGCEDGDQMVF